MNFILFLILAHCPFASGDGSSLACRFSLPAYCTPPCIACLANSPDGFSVYSQLPINVGPHSGSKHQTSQLMPLPSRYLMIDGPYGACGAALAPAASCRGGPNPPNSVAMMGYVAAAKPKSSSHFGSHGCGRLLA